MRIPGVQLGDPASAERIGFGIGDGCRALRMFFSSSEGALRSTGASLLELSPPRGQDPAPAPHRNAEAADSAPPAGLRGFRSAMRSSQGTQAGRNLWKNLELAKATVWTAQDVVVARHPVGQNFPEQNLLGKERSRSIRKANRATSSIACCLFYRGRRVQWKHGAENCS